MHARLSSVGLSSTLRCCTSTCNIYRGYATAPPPYTTLSSSPVSVDSQQPSSSRQQVPLERAVALSGGAKYGNPFPDLMKPDALLDTADVRNWKPTKRGFRNRLVARNDPSIFEWAKMMDAIEEVEKNGGNLEVEGVAAGEEDGHQDEARNVIAMASAARFSPQELRNLHVYPLIVRRVTQQTGKGKIHSMYVLVVVGNGDGLVGYGEAKDDEMPVARDKAYAKALRNLDYVERFESRTLWTDVEAKFGATRIILRPRPVGFGLHCNPNVHQVLKAAGIKDASAKVWGSRNPLSVIKTLFRMLHAGNAPIAMGDGVGGGARRLDKGSGLRGKDAVERDRGRKLVDLRTY